jgi:polysaccharide chain length determinant protein (PEP-CTERM system associated)
MQQAFAQLLIYAKEIWRYRWHAALASWVICLAGWGMVYFVPSSYEASARVFVDTQTILRPLLTGLTVQLNLDQQIMMMTRTLISRPNIEKVIQMSGLESRVKTPEDKEALIDRLNRQIEVKTAGKDNLYTITYTDRSPETAKRVVQSLITIFVDSSLGSKRKDTEQARRFLDEQIKIYEEKLVQAENALKEFKQKNLGFTPAQGPGQDYFARVVEANTVLAQARLELQEAENAREALRKQIAATGESEAQTELEDTANPELEARILALRKNLDNMRLNFTEQHPDIVGTKRVLAQLEEQRRLEIEARKKGGGTIRRAAPDKAIQLALAEAGANVASLRARVAEYERRYAVLRAAADKMPQIEAEFVQLNRDYDVNKQSYEKLLQRRDSAQMSSDVDTSTGAFDFRIIDPPRVPSVPTSPNRLQLITTVLLVGLAGGFALAFLLSQLTPTFSDRKTLREATGLPILGAVSMTWTDQERRKRKKNFAVLATSYMGLLVAYGGIIANLVILSRQA